MHMVLANTKHTALQVPASHQQCTQAQVHAHTHPVNVVHRLSQCMHTLTRYTCTGSYKCMHTLTRYTCTGSHNACTHSPGTHAQAFTSACTHSPGTRAQALISACTHLPGTRARALSPLLVPGPNGRWSLSHPRPFLLSQTHQRPIIKSEWC
jgi:hypothetical protein